jgi:N-acetylneuraminic acid mutarotase
MSHPVAHRLIGAVLLALLTLPASAQQAGSNAAPQWTWISGSNNTNPSPVYGSQGIAAPANIPGGRSQGGAGLDASGSFWLFGGQGIDKFGSDGYLNDLWKFDGTNWMWVSGSDVINRTGSYGTKGLATPTNVPGSRSKFASWSGPSNTLWVFGGEGMGGTSLSASMNDLWKFDGTNWTWIAGGDAAAQGVYTVKGQASPANMPGSRTSPTSWTDGAGNLWLFGGFGYDLGGHSGYLNELWKFDGTNWTWVSGNLNANGSGVYGTQGVPDITNVPGARQASASWIDNAGNFYVYGGMGYDAAGQQGLLGDLWKFDGSNWTWLSGPATGNLKGTYGTKGVAVPANEPGGRSGAYAWVEPSGLVYLFGGMGLDSAGTQGDLNDLWTFDGSLWAWVSGSSTANAFGVYGTKKKTAKANVAGARMQGARWRTSDGSLWLFGGNGDATTGGSGELGDLWRIAPSLDPNAAPPAPSGLMATAGNSAVLLSWTGSMGATSYIINRATHSNREVPVQSGVLKTVYLDSSLTNGTKVYYTVQAQGPGGTSAASTEVTATPSSLLPLSPTLTTVSGNNQVALSWTSTGTSYIVSRSQIDGGPYTVLASSFSGTSYLDGTAQNDTRYYYIVVAMNAAGSSLASNQASAKPTAPVAAAWAWMGGATTYHQTAVYGAKGVASSTNDPGSRTPAASWTDASGNFWLFGGGGYDPSSISGAGALCDLWKFDGTNWTWVAGPSTFNTSGIGVYGTKGVPAAANNPGGRSGSASWIDASGNLWLFGGSGYDGNGSSGELNDLWKWNGSQWTWIAGSNLAVQSGVYGTMGIPAAGNTPGARQYSAYARDGAGNFWLFGGETSSQNRYWNDLWKFDGTNWTWVSGSNTPGQAGVWGTKGTASPSNVVNARSGSSAWVDAPGRIILFGGYGPQPGVQGWFNDVWRFDGALWTWIAGTDQMNPSGVPGTKGVPDPANTPGGRSQGTRWTDAAGAFWFFGGAGYDSSGGLGSCNDLWKFDGTSWTWVSGALTVWQVGIYGTKGASSPTNVPGARSNAAPFVDAAGNLWLFGGSGNDSLGNTGTLDDLWRWGP